MNTVQPDWIDDRLLLASGVRGQELPAGTLYVVATAIGNAADMTVRALWVLSQMDAIAAEDTRTTRPLLARYGIQVSLLAAHRHNERAVAETIVAQLRVGRRVALVSDAGTPAISDPGALIVRAVLDAQLRVVPIPGASSLTAAASAAGLVEGPLTFAGFAPATATARTRWLREWAGRGEPFVFFEAPHRISQSATALARELEPQRRIVIARELSKKFETIFACTAATVVEQIGVHEQRGEFVVLVDAAPAANTVRIDAITQRWLDELARELPAGRAAAVAAKASGLPRDLLYAALSRRAPAAE